MKRIMASILMLGMVLVIPLLASAKPYVIEVYPTDATYTQVKQSGITVYKRSDVSKRLTLMGFSGTSECQVIDTADWEDVRGRLTFQFKSITGTTPTSTPVSGTTISAHWRGSVEDSPEAWTVANKNTFIDGTNAFSGNTKFGYDINDYGSGVTPFRYFRIEYESGISKELGGGGNIVPLGTLFVR